MIEDKTLPNYVGTEVDGGYGDGPFDYWINNNED